MKNRHYRLSKGAVSMLFAAVIVVIIIIVLLIMLNLDFLWGVARKAQEMLTIRV